MLPSPSTAVPFDITATRFGAGGEGGDLVPVLDDCQTRRGDPRRISERQVALVGQGLGGDDREFTGGRESVVIESRLVQCI